MNKTKILHGLLPFYFSLLLGLAFPLSAFSAPVCRQDITNCDPVSDDNCLEKLYACGRYDHIVHTLWTEDFDSTAVQKYFIGVSLYGMYVRSRAKSLQCEYAKGAKENLEDYLMEKEGKFHEKGTYGTVGHMNQLYHATKILNDLKGLTGCLESAFTRARMKNFAKGVALNEGKSVFLAPSDSMKDMLNSIILAIQGFVSKASDLETGLALRRIEIKTGERYLNNIKVIFKEIFGDVQVTPDNDVTIKTDVLAGIEKKSSGFLREVNQQEFDFKRALGGVNPEEYSNIRLRNITEAYNMLKKTAFHINMVGEVMNMDKSRPFGKLWTALNAPDGGLEIKNSLSEIKKSWKNYGNESGLCERVGTGNGRPQRWYCK